MMTLKMALVIALKKALKMKQLKMINLKNLTKHGLQRATKNSALSLLSAQKKVFGRLRTSITAARPHGKRSPQICFTPNGAGAHARC